MEDLERQQQKAALLRKIQQQRIDLSRASRDWQQVTAPYDRGWQVVMQFRRYLLVAGGALAIWNIRRPSKLMTLTRRGLNIWSSFRMVRSTLGKILF